jgi:hypothetical protein
MRKLNTVAPAVAAALGLVAVAVAGPAGAYHGGCYKDDAGNCYWAPLNLATGDDSPEDMAAWGHTPDSRFAYLVTHDDNAPGFRIMDFSALKAQGLWACQERTNGARGIDVAHALQNMGGYTDDQAINIESSAVAVYCKWNVPTDTPPPPPPGE